MLSYSISLPLPMEPGFKLRPCMGMAMTVEVIVKNQH